MCDFENAERVLMPKGRDMRVVLSWLEEQGFAVPLEPTKHRRRLHRKDR